MANNKEALVTKGNREVEMLDEIAKLDKLLEQRKKEFHLSEQRLTELERQFTAINKNVLWKLLKHAKAIKKVPRTTIAYLIGRRNLKQLYSKTYKKKKAANQLKKYTYHLYNLGFSEKALFDLEAIYKETGDRYLRAAVAWELALWYSTKYTADGARQAKIYFLAAISEEKNTEQLRKAAIQLAECHEILGELCEGKKIIYDALTTQKHPDLYLAAANLEENPADRIKWINKALEVYEIQPIYIPSTNGELVYDNLSTDPLSRKTANGPKVSVIIPAYNSETGIRTAIESILTQTWKNIELLVVDDCSKDKTAEVIKEYTKKDPRVKLFQTPANSGPYAARNIALNEASGEFVTINDADDWSHAEKIETQVTHLIANQNIIANTSEHARLTEAFKLYRRGSVGKYIFSNMSSLMFRREPVLREVGYWDNVRFAADSEYKRRMAKIFGEENVVDLKTGPLSFPRQAEGSLTGSSAFGYNGHLKGVRREYAEAHRYYHKKAANLYYPFQQEKRPYPVPEPMWPKREKKHHGKRLFDVVIVADFRLAGKAHQLVLEEIKIHHKLGMRTGLVQMACYDNKVEKEINPEIRDLLNGDSVQLLVYGERIMCNLLIVRQASVLQEKQEYIPEVESKVNWVVIDSCPNSLSRRYNLRQWAYQLAEYFGSRGKWYPQDAQTREKVMRSNAKEVKSIKLAGDNWIDITKDKSGYISLLEDCFVDRTLFQVKEGSGNN
ncbi:glycosyltransferase family A protein [Virgibacillus sp. C22-A2]|uniref:Glycosyltransferase family A protein n=1 Tax=Virgibacillus tibetensis TaxID=3042313 RepID=A0ABU6KL70_9BACI|nr:glycosyltransferase family A protein [Virgibacillus sp. C22-A2]